MPSGYRHRRAHKGQRDPGRPPRGWGSAKGRRMAVWATRPGRPRSAQARQGSTRRGPPPRAARVARHRRLAVGPRAGGSQVSLNFFVSGVPVWRCESMRAVVGAGDDLIPVQGEGDRYSRRPRRWRAKTQNYETKPNFSGRLRGSQRRLRRRPGAAGRCHRAGRLADARARAAPCRVAVLWRSRSGKA